MRLITNPEIFNHNIVFKRINMSDSLIEYLLNKINNADEFNELVYSTMRYIVNSKIERVDTEAGGYYINNKLVSFDKLCTGEKIVFLSTLLHYINTCWCIADLFTQITMII